MAAKKRSLFEKMRDNPKGDWTIHDVQKLCRNEGLEFRQGAGSHSVVSSPHLRDSLTVPARKPIKSRYIKEMVGYTLAHRHHLNSQNEGD